MSTSTSSARAEAAGDDVALEVAERLGVDALPAGEFPSERVVVGQLLHAGAADAVGARVADVGDPSALGAQHHGGAGGAEAVELGVVPADLVDGGVGLLEGAGERGQHAVLGDVLEERQRDDADGLGAGLLADGVAAHAVGDEEDVAVGLKVRVVGGGLGDAGVLVVAALDADVGQASVADVHARVA